MSAWGQSLRIAAAGRIAVAPGAPLASRVLAHAPPRRAEQMARMDRLCGLALLASDRCLLPSDPATPAPVHVGQDGAAILCGSVHGCLGTDTEFFHGVQTGQASPRLFAYTLHSSPVGEVSIHHGLRGAGIAIVGSITAGLEALAEAGTLIASGAAPCALVLSTDVAFAAAEGSGAARDLAVALWVVAEEDEAQAGSSVAAGQSGVRIVAVTTAFAAGQPQRAIGRALAALRRGPAGAVAHNVPLTMAAVPPLWLLAQLVDPKNRRALLRGAAQGRLLIAAQDPTGRAAVVLAECV